MGIRITTLYSRQQNQKLLGMHDWRLGGTSDLLGRCWDSASQVQLCVGSKAHGVRSFGINRGLRRLRNLGFLEQ